ncbi:GNAT family N-acetyltransferase [Gelidibacter maritimus]|uniref:GNAT family N-acetyltransferase n=1 Tax=Gelidibacter maritimus TaxID=2761487 RepID=A0A7W2R3M4_9FLAO|nr:GNAT family N-acetyltransferase [Gelidibacter maritimus]MBA6152788.1 GNAT family N-acetyltransferase [Gelidibacter maritimus]
MIEIREATLEDIPFITTIFRDTITNVNAKDYSEKQIRQWASGASDIDQWKDRIANSYFIVAELNDTIVGFAYLSKGNYFDGLFVHKDFLRRGFGIKLMRIIESQALAEGYEVIKADVSITALPFFEDQYYIVEKKQKKNYKGLAFEIFKVYKEL